jgi:hypothetical protein
MGLYVGAGAAIGFGTESTWGTAVARARWERATGTGLRRVRTREVVQDLSGTGGGSANYMHMFTSRDRVRGTLAFNGHYHSYGLTTLLKHAMGSCTDGGAGPYTHTYTLTATMQTGLTIEMIMGSNYSEVFEGCKVNRLTLTHEIGRPMGVEADIIGQTSGGAASAGTATYNSTYTYVLPEQGGSFTWNSVAYVVRRCVVSIDNKLVERDQIGSLNSLEPKRGEKPDVLITLDIERDSDALQTAFLADTESASATITFTSGSYSIAYTGHNSQIVDYDPPASIGGIGPLVQRLTLRCLSNGTNEGLGIVVTNANSATI